MGEFAAGKWLIGLSLYFMTFFLIVFSVVNNVETYELDDIGVYAGDPGFGSVTLNESAYSDPGRLNSTIEVTSVRESVVFMTGFGSSTIGIGFPSTFQWIFSFIFFYIPAVMLFYALYMILPFLH